MESQSHEEHHKEPLHNHEKVTDIIAGDLKTSRAAARSWILWSGCLLATTLAGVALMAFWVVAFHRNNEQLWMVPVSLIMVVTPVLVWFSAISDTYLHKTRALVRPATTAETPALVVLMDPDLEK